MKVMSFQLKYVEVLQAFWHVLYQPTVYEPVPFLSYLLSCNISLNCLFWLSKKNILTVYKTLSVASSFLLVGEGVTHQCGADVGLTLHGQTYSDSVVWMGSVGGIVTLRPFLLWRHAKWACTKLDISLFLCSLCVWVYVQGMWQCPYKAQRLYNYFFIKKTNTMYKVDNIPSTLIS